VGIDTCGILAEADQSLEPGESSPVSTDERAEATRRKIVNAACDVIAELGFEGVRMRIVATRADVSSALLHYHFENREKLFLAALRFSFENAGSAVHSEVPTDYPDHPYTWRLARIVDDCLPVDAGTRRDFLLWQELWLRAVRDAESKALAVDLYGELRDWVGAAIRDGVAAGEFAACDEAAVTDLLLALTDGYGIRLTLADPLLTLDRARGNIWTAIGRELGIAGPFPVPLH
jgi:AcrR family transcriptional regulator